MQSVSINTLAVTITYHPDESRDPINVDLSKCPPQTVHKFLVGGVAHLFGNEAASRVTSWVNKLERDAVKALGENPSKEAIAKAIADSAPTTAAKESKKIEIQLEMLADAYAGELGTRATGPRRDPLEVEMENVAVRNVRAIVATYKDAAGKAMKLPADDKTILTFPNGMTRTRSEMIGNWLKNNGESAKKEAEKVLTERAKKESAAKALADKTAGQSPDAIGI